MATIRIWREEFDRLPNHCVVCGAFTTRKQWVRFTHPSGWIGFTLFFCGGLVPLLIVYLLLSRVHRLRMPVCIRHIDHWFWKDTFPIWSIALMFCTAPFAIGYANKAWPDSLMYMICLYVALTVYMIGNAIIVTRECVRGTEYFDESVVVTSVSDPFADAIRAAREREDRGPQAGPDGNPAPDEPEDIDPRVRPEA